MERSTIQKLRELCPNIGILEKAIAWGRKYQLTHDNMSTKEIKNAEENTTIKFSIVNNYKKQNELDDIDKNIEKLFDAAPQYASKSDNQLEDIRTDIKFCYIAYGFKPYEYLCLDLEGSGYDYRSQFISSRDQHVYQSVINNVIDSNILIDKSKTYEKFKKYFRRDAITVEKSKDLNTFSNFIEKHPIIVKKPVYSGLGRGIERIDTTTSSKTIEELFETILNGGKTLIEESLIQSDVMKALNSDSVNTVRVVTVSIPENVEIAYSFLRMGRKGSFVDNGGSMGIFAGVNVDTGMIETNGYDELNVCYRTHPDSGIEIQGFQLPEWDKLVAIVQECSSMVPTLKSVSWDMAYACSDEYPDFAWTIIETNPLGDFLNQIAYKTGYKEKWEQIVRNLDTSISL